MDKLQDLLKKMFPTDGSRSSEFFLLLLIVLTAIVFVLFKDLNVSEAFNNIADLTMVYILGRSGVKGVQKGIEAWKSSSKEEPVGPLNG